MLPGAPRYRVVHFWLIRAPIAELAGYAQEVQFGL